MGFGTGGYSLLRFATNWQESFLNEDKKEKDTNHVYTWLNDQVKMILLVNPVIKLSYNSNINSSLSFKTTCKDLRRGLLQADRNEIRILVSM